MYSIIDKHGGQIEVHSEVNKGTTFQLRLPALGEVYEKYKTKNRQSQTVEIRGGKILVMDDEEMILEMADTMLTELGYEVTTCKNGEEAVKIYKKSTTDKEPFTAAIMDLTIPGGMGGQEAARQILDLFPKARLIVSSGYSNDPIMAKYNEYGFRGTLIKPYKLKDVVNALHSIFL